MVWLLGVSQIVGYGTLYYSFAILARNAAPALGWPEPWLFGAFSLGLLVGGLVAHEVGKRMDRHSAGAVMTLGSIVAAAALLVAGLAPNGMVFAAAIVLTQVAGTLVLYDAAFTALVQVAGASARARINHLTLIAGFASTIFWPLTAWLDAVVGWRTAYVAFAAATLLVCVPIHALLAQRRAGARAATPAATAPTEPAVPHPAAPASAMWFATAGFALSGFALSAVLAQMVPLLTAVGLGASALLVSTLFGPAQVLVRFANLLAGAARHPVFPALLALALLPAAIAVLAFGAPALVAAVLFAVMLGFGSGLKSIVHGSLPLALFGPDAYGARLGLMASVRQVLASVAPFVLATLIEAVGVRPALWLVAGVGLLGLACLVQVARSVRPAH
ncbi:arsenite efflux MFS transporter ArsK [Devosia sp. 66-22]|uniref:arsenite efflux MFS transporter ArsK n=1 Tax=Devosia sp. 66-22 TaxID=1895753 RepID=UPI000AE592CE|nr:arsenite efflux MFS transporter ArsK [Devosia sp. 66-22]